MSMRIESIQYYDYTHRVGRCEILRNFASCEMTYFGKALSTPEFQVNAVPHEFKLSTDATNRIRECVIAEISKLEEISRLLAENSPQYISVCYFDGTEKFYKYNTSLCKVFDMAWKLRPRESNPKELGSNQNTLKKKVVGDLKQQQQIKATATVSKEKRSFLSTTLGGKKKVSVDDLSMEILITAVDIVGKLECFDDIEDERTLAVNLGYFYGYLKLQLNSITKLDVANTVIEKSISHLECAIKGKMQLDDLGKTVSMIADRAVENMKYTAKKANNIFMGMSVFYILDLQNTNEIDISKMETAEKNMRALYSVTSNIIKNVKIVK